MSTEGRVAINWTGIVIGALVVAGAVWAYSSYRNALHEAEQARMRYDSKVTLKILGIGAHNYHDRSGAFPFLPIPDGDHHSWVTFMLPELEALNVYERVHLESAWDDPVNRPALTENVPSVMNTGVEVLQADAGYAVTHYEANAELYLKDHAVQFRDVKDGTSNTMLIGEVNSNFRAWGDPSIRRDLSLGINKAQDGFGSPFTGGGQFVFCDGSVRFLSEDTDPEILRAMSTPNGGERLRRADNHHYQDQWVLE